MNKLLKKTIVMLIILLTVVAYGYGQETGAPQNKPDYRTIAIAFDPVQYLVMQLFTGVLVISGNVELAVAPNFSLLLDLAYLSVSNSNGFQVGGGGRYYYTGKGVNGAWIGGYFDAFVFNSIGGLEAGFLTGYKLVLGAFFIDPFVGLRFGIPQISAYRYGMNIGLTF